MAKPNRIENKHSASVRGKTQSHPRSVARFVGIMRKNLPEIRERYKVKSIAVFGSYVQKSQKKGSDLDMLVEFSETPSLFEFIEVEQYLSDLLGVKVDLVMRDGLKHRIGRHILEEAIPI